MRDKIRMAYQNACNSYEDLLTTVVAIEEELLHISAPSRLDYFKSGCQFDKRVHEKRKQFLNALTPMLIDATLPATKACRNREKVPLALAAKQDDLDSPPSTKKAKTEQEQ